MDTNPVAEVTESVESRLETLFGAKPEPEAVEANPDSEPDQDTVEADADPEAAKGQAEEEDVELDEDLVIRLPKTAAEKLKNERMLHADYTRKTQTLAEQRKQIEAHGEHLATVEKLREKTFSTALEVAGIENQLKQYEQINWDALDAADPAESRRLERQMSRLREQQAAKREELAKAVQTAQEEDKAEWQKQVVKTRETIKELIPNFDDKLDERVGDFARKQGLSQAEIRSVSTSPNLYKFLHDAMRWQDLQASKPKVTQKAQNAPPVKVMSRSAPQAQRDNAAAVHRDRLKKSGRKEDAEAYLESLFRRK